MVEPCTGIILSCLPIIKVLLGRPFRSISKPSDESGSKMRSRSRGFSNAAGHTSSTATGTHSVEKHLDEHPLTDLSSKSAAASVVTHDLSSRGREDGDSQLGDLEQGKVETEVHGPLGPRRSSSVIHITQEWKVR